MQKLPSPITKETSERIFSQWIDIINRNESGSIVNIPKRDQLYRIKQFIEDKKIIKKFLKSDQKVRFLTIDFSSQPIENPNEVDEYLNKHLKKNIKGALLIIDADYLIKEKTHLLSYLDSLRHQKPISLLYFFQKKITNDDFLKKFSSYTTLFQNVIIFPFFEKKDAVHFLNYIIKFFNASVPKNVQDSIIYYCGGCLWLITEAVRHYKKTHDTKTLFNHENMILKLKVLFNEMTPLEQILLEKIIKKELNFSLKEKEILDYLLKIRIIIKVKRTYKITIPLLADYIYQQLIQKTQISINKLQQIIINNIVIDYFFSNRERRFIRFLLTNFKNLISREGAASIIWGKSYQEYYTDWALDQFIRRLRNKLTKLGLNRDLIKTKKNQGFVLNKNYAS